MGQNPKGQFKKSSHTFATEVSGLIHASWTLGRKLSSLQDVNARLLTDSERSRADVERLTAQVKDAGNCPPSKAYGWCVLLHGIFFCWFSLCNVPFSIVGWVTTASSRFHCQHFFFFLFNVRFSMVRHHKGTSCFIFNAMGDVYTTP